VDETYIKVKKVWMYLYRAVDSEGSALEFLLSATHDAKAAKRFFVKALSSAACSAPQAHPIQEQEAQPTAQMKLSLPFSSLTSSSESGWEPNCCVG